MAFSVSPRALRTTPRYAVVRRMVEGVAYDAPTLEGTLYREYCETFADVRTRLSVHAGRMSCSNGRFYWVREPKQWFADAVKNICRNQRRVFTVAQSTDGSRTEWLSVIAL